MSDDTPTPPPVQTIKVECKANQLRSSIDTIAGETAGLLAITIKLDANIINMANTVQEMYMMVKHLHDSHYHPYPHEQRDMYNTPPGAPVYPQIQGPTDRLLAEYNNNMDFDMNGLIYGYDFIIDPSDPQKPQYLKNVELSMCEDIYEHLVKLSWVDFLSTLPKEILHRDKMFSKQS